MSLSKADHEPSVLIPACLLSHGTRDVVDSRAGKCAQGVDGLPDGVLRERRERNVRLTACEPAGFEIRGHFLMNADVSQLPKQKIPGFGVWHFFI